MLLGNIPVLRWERVTCTTPPRIWYPVPRSRHPKLGQTVGDGNDFTADTTPELISMAIGAFPKVKGVKAVQSRGSLSVEAMGAGRSLRGHRVDNSDRRAQRSLGAAQPHLSSYARRVLRSEQLVL